MQEYILETRNVCKLFGDLVANENISIQVRRGCVHSIIGENGAGKSTLMNMIAGMFRPTSGEILINGQSQVFRSPNDAAKNGIGMVHQEFMLFSDLTVIDNLMMGFETTRGGVFLDRQTVRRELCRLCEEYSFHIPLDAYVRDLPVSIKQQVEIVKVLYKGADIIILDEPTSVLTPQGIEGLFEALRNLRRLGKTIILITHKLKEVLEISDYITVLKNGKVTGNVLPQDVDEQALANLMVGRDVLFNTHKSPKQVGAPIFEVKELSAADDNHIEKVRNISFDVRRGEIVGIAGVAGSGQTELVECLFGLRKPISGRILYQGKDITRLSPRERRLSRIGYVPQDRMGTGTSAEASVMENAVMGHHLRHCRRGRFLLNYSEANEFAGRVINQFSVKADGVKARVGSLSGGNIQKLVVGREFSQETDLLIIEDPTRGIDVGAIEFIWQKIIDISNRGISILLISHELGEVMELSDRILVIYNGEIAAELENVPELTEEKVGLYMLGGNADETT